MKTAKDIMNKKANIGKIVNGYRIDKDDIITDVITISMSNFNDLQIATDFGDKCDAPRLSTLKQDFTTDKIIDTVYAFTSYDIDYPDARKSLDSLVNMAKLMFDATTDDTNFGPLSLSIAVYQ
jgi:hypothetical protein